MAGSASLQPEGFSGKRRLERRSGQQCRRKTHFRSRARGATTACHQRPVAPGSGAFDAAGEPGASSMTAAARSLDGVWRDLERRFEDACAQSRAQVVNQLNQLLRRFRQYGGEKDWVRLVLEGAGIFSRQVALF